MGDRLEFRILGPLEVRRDGVVVRVGGPRQRALLALLLCNANRAVSRAQLVDELLSDQSPDSAERVLHVQISRLRKAIASDGEEPRVLARPPGYVLRVEEGELDLDEFERRLAAGRRAREEGDFEQAAAEVRDAESLWRGRPLADLEFEPFARLEVERLEELRLLAIEERIDAELALGQHAALVPELELLVEEHPLRERLRGQLMLALYRAGRQPEALGTYRTGRTRLVEELALEPSPRLRELEQAILRQDPSIELGEQPARSPVGVLIPPLDDRAPESLGSPSGRRRRPPWQVAALALLAVGVVAAVAVVLMAGSMQTVRVADANGLALLSPAGAVEATIGLPGAPTRMASGFGSLWVSEAGAAKVVRIDAKRKTVTATIPVGRGPGAITARAGAVWVVNTLDGTVSRIDPGADAVVQTIHVGAQPSDLAVAAGGVWVANHGDATLSRIDPHTGQVRAIVNQGISPRALAGTGSTLWLADDTSGTVARLDAATGTQVDAVHVGDAPSALAVTAGRVWVLDRLDATLSVIDSQRDVVVSTVPLRGAPGALAVSGNAIWLADERSGNLTRFDPDGRAAARTIQVSSRPEALAAEDGLWVATASGGAGHRGGTLRVAVGGGVIDTIDPAASTSPNVSLPQLLGLTNDGLVTLEHTDGPDGARLVPDLAVSLPRSPDAGRTYTFRLRTGVRYSTGAPVRPRDVRGSFERLFKLRSSGASFYLAIAGAPGCLRAPSRCDLSRGIIADEQADTVTFHLGRPDPDFLAKLTLPYAFLLPASTPAQATRSPLPATGPYQIASYRPGQELLLVRNRQFHEWSNAAQPDGYPNRIVMRLRPTAVDAARLMAASDGDFMTNVGAIPDNQRSYFFLQHPSQVHTNPSMNTGFLFLNVHAPPFDDLRVRQALNLALDRSRVAAAFGGPTATTPTCQLLPPGIPGYRRYCPYTSSPGRDGRWHGQDIARARQLVAASGTRGMPVIVWGISEEPPIDSTPTVDALRRLGYRTSLRRLSETAYFNYTDDSRNHAQVIDGGWSADYPTANDFIGKLTCAYFVPGSSTVDSSEFCDPAFDRSVAHAAALQMTNPPAAARLFARLDRELTDRAVLLPTVTLNTTDLLSTRVGNYRYNPVWGAMIDQLWVQ